MPESAFEVDDASLRWGVNNESNNRGAAPGTFNFFSAGKIGDPATGGQVLTDASSGALWRNGERAGWKAVEGDVRIEKLQADNTFEAATWAGTKTDKRGSALGGYASNSAFSDHQIVLTGGQGQVDPVARAATIRWKGDFTIIYYSGMTFFYVSDPVLTVVDGIGTLTATLGGFSSSMDNQSEWVRVVPRPGVVLADLGSIDLDRGLGFTAVPAYKKVSYTPPTGGIDQVRNGNFWGAFPQSFLDFQHDVGAAAYWYSTGGAVDRNKVASPVTVSYAAGSPVAPVIPDSGSTQMPGPGVENSAPPPPVAPPVAPSVSPVAPPQRNSPQPVLPALVGVEPLAEASAANRIVPAATVLPARPPSVTEVGLGPAGPWVGGLVLLALAGLAGLVGLVAMSPSVYRPLRKI